MIRNPRAHAHRRGRPATPAPAGVPVAEPATPAALGEALRAWAGEGVTRLVVDGGDGTLREVLGALPAAFGDRLPELAVLPSGKTNALAHDVGAPRGWTCAAALAATGVAHRSPLQVERVDGTAPPRRGFVWGAGAFTEAIASAQRLHAAGLFGAAAVGVALAGCAARGLWGARDDPWRAGVPMRTTADGADAEGAGVDEARRFLLLLSSLERLPLGLRPFGPPRPGLKRLDVLAPPQRLLSALPLVLSGRDRPWLREAGYRRDGVEELALWTAGPFVLDGELFEGGELRIRRGAPVRFVTP